MKFDGDDTCRGYPIGRFRDQYGKGCSIQDSSLATEACVWVGIDNPKVKVLVPGKSWQDFPVPEEALIESRMHLTIDQAILLRDALTRFIETGSCAP